MTTTTHATTDVPPGETASAVTAAHLARIDQREPEVQAWAFLDPDHARAQAAALDRALAAGAAPGPLFGVPVGIKDIFATADMPTENGTHLHAGRRPEADAAVVERLRVAGAVIMGKTVTTELAAFMPGKTRNPHNPARTPGGSSSGSAAAVAAGMVPMALGSQTNGSVIRPASYCGVHGFKPTHGLISRRGMTPQAPTVDHVGMFARSLAEIARLADVLIGHDPADPASRPMAAPRLAAGLATGRAVAPRLAFVPGPTWEAAEPATQAAFVDLAARLQIPEIALPEGFAEAIEVHRLISWAELAHALAPEYRVGPGGLSDRLRGMIEGGQAVTAPAYLGALSARNGLIAAMAGVFAEYDALLTPAATGEAPLGLDSTGSPLFCTTWTLLGTPAVSLPLLRGPAGLPVGVQLVSARGHDAALLATAAWLEQALAGAG
jgi:Asp-tRNA(Asn)/Glu-tRNA(Gln) amidotransferase A subunit family amidase